jgi:hypothetical protein
MELFGALLLRLRAYFDAGNFHARHFSSVTDRSMIAFSPSEFVGDNFLVFAMLDDLGGDGGAIDWRAMFDFVTISVH